MPLCPDYRDTDQMKTATQVRASSITSEIGSLVKLAPCPSPAQDSNLRMDEGLVSLDYEIGSSIAVV